MSTYEYDAAGSDPIAKWLANGAGTEKLRIYTDGSLLLGANQALALRQISSTLVTITAENTNSTLKLQTRASGDYIDALTIDNSQRVGIGLTAPGSRLEIKGAGSTSATSSLNVTDSAGTSLLYVRDDGKLGIGRTPDISRLTIKGLGSTSSTYALAIEDSNGNGIFIINDDGWMSVGTGSAPTEVLYALGNIKATGDVIVGNALRLPVSTANPSNPVDGMMYVNNNTGVYQLRVYMGGWKKVTVTDV